MTTMYAGSATAPCSRADAASFTDTTPYGSSGTIRDAKTSITPTATGRDALDRPGAFQVGLSAPTGRVVFGNRARTLTMTLLASDAGEGAGRTRSGAMREDTGGKCALIYMPNGGTVGHRHPHLDKLAGPRVHAAWFDPRTGRETEFLGDFPANGARTFVAPNAAPADAPDWVLTLD